MDINQMYLLHQHHVKLFVYNFGAITGVSLNQFIVYIIRKN